MARRIKETPILDGEDAVNFLLEMHRVENLPLEDCTPESSARKEHALRRTGILLHPKKLTEKTGNRKS